MYPRCTHETRNNSEQWIEKSKLKPSFMMSHSAKVMSTRWIKETFWELLRRTGQGDGVVHGHDDDDMLTPTGYPPPHTAADMAHSTHSTQPALRPHRTTPRAEDKPPQTRRPHSNGLCSPLSEGPLCLESGRDVSHALCCCRVDEVGDGLAFTRYCHCQYCVVYIIITGGRGETWYCAIVRVKG